MVFKMSVFRLSSPHHGILYGILACADCILCGEALLSNSWLAAFCCLVASVAYSFFASHSWRQHKASAYGRESDNREAVVQSTAMSTPSCPPVNSTRPGGAIEIALLDGIKIRVASDVDGDALYQVLSTLRR